MLSILNSNLEVSFLEGLYDETSGDDIQEIRRTDFCRTKIFCKIKNKIDGTSALELAKLSFVIYENDVLYTENIEYKFVFETDENNQKYINIVYNGDDALNWGATNASIIKCFINYEATLFSNVLKSSDVNEFVQSSTLIYEVPVSQPLFKSNSNIVYIEDSLYNINNDKDKYTYVSKILTGTGYNLFGVKRKEFFITREFNVQDTNDLKELNNINADVVKLKPSTTQVQIYSFKNGPQYMELSTDTFNQGIANNGKILPANKTNDFNIKFYGSNGYVSSGNVSAHLEGMDAVFSQLHSTITLEEEHDCLLGFLSYSFTVPYVFSTEINEPIVSYTKIRNQEEIVKRAPNAIISENTYIPLQDHYTNISENLLRTYSDVLEIYERKVNYVKLDRSLYTQEDIDNNIDQYYKFNQRTSTYIQLSNFDDANSDIYVQCISYNKIASNIRTSVNATNPARIRIPVS